MRRSWPPRISARPWLGRRGSGIKKAALDQAIKLPCLCRRTAPKRHSFDADGQDLTAERQSNDIPRLDARARFFHAQPVQTQKTRPGGLLRPRARTIEAGMPEPFVDADSFARHFTRRISATQAAQKGKAWGPENQHAGVPFFAF